MSFSLPERQATLNSLATRPIELLIIGGGVVGASVAAHAARLGLETLLVEKEDFAAGASSNSTGLAHAGLRYLAQGRVLYVFHESRERRRLQQLAPHWVKPFNFLYPVYQRDAFPLWMVRLGTWIYDRMAWLDAFLAQTPSPRGFEHVLPADLKSRVPGLTGAGLMGATEYFVDAQVQDHQFTLSFALDAVAHGARVLNHTAVSSITESSDGGHAVELQDEFSKKTYQVKPRLIINCAGAWIDGVRHLAGLSGEMVTRSRGTHLIVDRIAEDPLIFSAPEKGRVFFVLPVGSDASVIGTTDILETGDPQASRPTSQECQALLQLLKRFFPDKTPVVRSLYWGVRPLYKQEGHVSEASREHKLVREKKSFWSLPGVKLTAGRAAGEEAAQAAYGYLKNKTAAAIDLGILPGADREARLRAWLEKHPEDRMPVLPAESWQIGEAGFCASEEMALTLNDFLWRRVKWPLYRDIPDVALDRIAQSMGRVLGWTEDDLRRQLQDFHQILKQHRLNS